MNLFHLSWKNLTFKPLSMFLSIVLFALGIGLVSLLFLLENQLQKNFEKNLAGIDLVVGAKGSPLQLILNSIYHIEAPTGNITLKEARPFLNPEHPLIQQAIPLSLGDSYRGYRIVGTMPDLVDLYDAEIAEGQVWEHNFEVTIGASVAKALDIGLGDEFKSSHGFTEDENLVHDDAHAFKVVGILRPSGTVLDQLILTTTQSFWLVHGYEEEEADDEEQHDEEEHEGEEEHHHENEEHDENKHHDEEHAHHRDSPKPLLEEDPEQSITSLLIKFKGRNFQALNMQRNINENTDMQAATPAIEINRLFSLMDTGEQALRVLAFVIILVSGLSIFISLFNSLKERKYELALMRVLGATPSGIFSLIILEGLLLAVIGFVCGIALSHISMQFLAAAMHDAYRYDFSSLQFLPEEAYLLVGALIIGFLAAIIQAMQACRTDIYVFLTSELE